MPPPAPGTARPAPGQVRASLGARSAPALVSDPGALSEARGALRAGCGTSGAPSGAPSVAGQLGRDASGLPQGLAQPGSTWQVAPVTLPEGQAAPPMRGDTDCRSPAETRASKCVPRCLCLGRSCATLQLDFLGNVAGEWRECS
ncbi:guanine nucleotide-binding protein G(s) subunit alpha isoforms XLas-like [Vidua chalybeata]|uniref:guanine nucleotide-binding protein G(s) subunit alpha isoforms XLas-like n=1 Tax=Vidua chalybeata TaxID=81927 RepID=UPI0023A89609|nr:guanine nucleotide-binding protein G(s) subunit alpha isoforms XLas-like [Vidua chalybeata]